MAKFRNVSMVLFVTFLLLVFSSWDDGRDTLIGPIPHEPVYADSTQWFIRDRGARVDLFYIISTETGDHLMDGDTCHFADTYDNYLRERMAHEMHAVDSFYSGDCNYFSPYYRQVSMQSWCSIEATMARLPLALSDVRRSWDYYIEHYNQGRPFVIAGFSQGAHAMMDIMRRMPDSIASRLVAAYVVGYKVTQKDLDSCPLIRPAQGATDTGVTICFNSVRSSEDTISVVSGGNLLCINPVNWRTDTVSASFVVVDQKRTDTLTARCDPERHLVLIGNYPDNRPMPVIGVPGNYHHRELKFYYPYICQNIMDRVAAYFEKKEE